MKYVPEIRPPLGSRSECAPGAYLPGLRSFRQEHWTAFSSLQSAVIALDGSRLFNLLEECRFCFGRRAHERALMTLRQWRDGQNPLPDDATGHLFTLLPRQLAPEEKLRLLRSLRQQWIDDLPKTVVSVTVRRGDDLMEVARQVAGSVSRTQEITLHTDLVAVQRWLAEAEGKALESIVQGTEHYIAAHRLAAVLVQLATLARLHTLTGMQIAVRVQARLVLPTLTVNLRFQPCFWRDVSLQNGHDSGRALLMRLQDNALRQPQTASVPGFTAHVLTDLTRTERQRLQSLAAAEGLRTESLLYEIQVQTQAARNDIENTMAAIERMRMGKLRGRVVSQHTASCCTARIEMRSGGCPLTQFSPFSR